MKESYKNENDGFSYDIKKQLGVISKDKKGIFQTEVNLISFRGAEPKVDIRKWNRETDQMLKGITLTKEEALKLADILYKEYKE